MEKKNHYSDEKSPIIKLNFAIEIYKSRQLVAFIFVCVKYRESSVFNVRRFMVTVNRAFPDVNFWKCKVRGVLYGGDGGAIALFFSYILRILG